jgi:hypothetical protein
MPPRAYNEPVSCLSLGHAQFQGLATELPQNRNVLKSNQDQTRNIVKMYVLTHLSLRHIFWITCLLDKYLKSVP